MVANPDYKPIIRKLLEKSEQGRLEWVKDSAYSNGFLCSLDKYVFVVWRDDEKYRLKMLGGDAWDKLFSVSAEEEVVYRDPGDKELFEALRNLYGLARQK